MGSLRQTTDCFLPSSPNSRKPQRPRDAPAQPGLIHSGWESHTGIGISAVTHRCALCVCGPRKGDRKGMVLASAAGMSVRSHSAEQAQPIYSNQFLYTMKMFPALGFSCWSNEMSSFFFLPSFGLQYASATQTSVILIQHLSLFICPKRADKKLEIVLLFCVIKLTTANSALFSYI